MGIVLGEHFQLFARLANRVCTILHFKRFRRLTINAELRNDWSPFFSFIMMGLVFGIMQDLRHSEGEEEMSFNIELFLF